MDGLRENWFWVVVGVGFVWMHLRMHGAHSHDGHGQGAHGRHGHSEPNVTDKRVAPNVPPMRSDNDA